MCLKKISQSPPFTVHGLRGTADFKSAAWIPCGGN